MSIDGFIGDVMLGDNGSGMLVPYVFRGGVSSVPGVSKVPNWGRNGYCDGCEIRPHWQMILGSWLALHPEYNNKSYV